MNGGPHPRDRLSQQLPESADNCCHDFPVWHCEGCSLVAETVRFELTDGCPSAVFKTAGLNHSPKSPGIVNAAPHSRCVLPCLTCSASAAVPQKAAHLAIERRAARADWVSAGGIFYLKPSHPAVHQSERAGLCPDNPPWGRKPFCALAVCQSAGGGTAVGSGQWAGSAKEHLPLSLRLHSFCPFGANKLAGAFRKASWALRRPCPSCRPSSSSSSSGRRPSSFSSCPASARIP